MSGVRLTIRKLWRFLWGSDTASSSDRPPSWTLVLCASRRWYAAATAFHCCSSCHTTSNDCQPDERAFRDWGMYSLSEKECSVTFRKESVKMCSQLPHTHKKSARMHVCTLTGHFIRYTLLVPGWTRFCLQNCLETVETRQDGSECPFTAKFWPYHLNVIINKRTRNYENTSLLSVKSWNYQKRRLKLQTVHVWMHYISERLSNAY